MKAELLLHHEQDSQDVGKVFCTSLSQVLVVYIGSTVALRRETRMEEEVTNGINSFVSNCEFKEEVSEVDTDILSNEKEITSSVEESSAQLCSLSSGQRRNVRSFQRHPSVDEWLLGRLP